MRCSVSVSTLAVASSNKRIGGSFRSARAIERRCFSPPESFTPRSPTLVSSWLGRALIKSSQRALRRAVQSSSSVALRLASMRFSRIVPLKRKASWVTYPIFSRNETLSMSRSS